MSREAFVAAVRGDPPDLATACLLLGSEQGADVDVPDGLAVLDALAATVRRTLPPQPSPRAAAEVLRRVLGEECGYAGTTADYLDVRGSLLHEVLRRRHGLPILLSVLWVEVARRAGTDAHLVGLPGHFVACVGDLTGERQLVDPFAGGRLVDLGALSARVVDATGAPLDPADLRPWSATETLVRVLLNVVGLAERPDPALTRTRSALWAADLALLLPGHPAWLRASRGRLRARLGDALRGAADLEAWAEVLAMVDPPAAEAVVREARGIRARMN